MFPSEIDSKREGNRNLADDDLASSPANPSPFKVPLDAMSAVPSSLHVPPPPSLHDGVISVPALYFDAPKGTKVVNEEEEEEDGEGDEEDDDEEEEDEDADEGFSEEEQWSEDAEGSAEYEAGQWEQGGGDISYRRSTGRVVNNPQHQAHGPNNSRTHSYPNIYQDPRVCHVNIPKSDHRSNPSDSPSYPLPSSSRGGNSKKEKANKGRLIETEQAWLHHDRNLLKVVAAIVIQLCGIILLVVAFILYSDREGAAPSSDGIHRSGDNIPLSLWTALPDYLLPHGEPRKGAMMSSGDGGRLASYASIFNNTELCATIEGANSSQSGPDVWGKPVTLQKCGPKYHSTDQTFILSYADENPDFNETSATGFSPIMWTSDTASCWSAALDNYMNMGNSSTIPVTIGKCDWSYDNTAQQFSFQKAKSEDKYTPSSSRRWKDMANSYFYDTYNIALRDSPDFCMVPEPIGNPKIVQIGSPLVMMPCKNVGRVEVSVK